MKAVTPFFILRWARDRQDLLICLQDGRTFFVEWQVGDGPQPFGRLGQGKTDAKRKGWSKDMELATVATVGSTQTSRVSRRTTSSGCSEGGGPGTECECECERVCE